MTTTTDMRLPLIHTVKRWLTGQSDTTDAPDGTEWVEAQLDRLEFVTWDRFHETHQPGYGRIINVFGWIDRPRDHADFVAVTFYPDQRVVGETTTSSAKYGEEISRRLNDGELPEGHTECERVEDHFDVEHCIRLEDRDDE